MPSETELDVLLSRVREDKADTTGKNRNAVAYDCWRMFEDLATRYKEEFAMRDRYKRQSNSWRDVALAQAEALQKLSKWPASYPANANIDRMRDFALRATMVADQMACKRCLGIGSVNFEPCPECHGEGYR